MKQLPLKREAIIPRIDGISRNVEKLRTLGKLPLSEFEKKGDTYDLVQHHLRLALEGIFHIGAHILSRLPGARVTSYKEIALRLGEKGIIEQTFAKKTLVQMAGYRTRLTHFYHDITPKEIYEIITKHLDDIEVFLQAVKEILSQPEEFGLTIE